MAGFLIAILSGALMSIQGVFNTGVTKSSSIWVAAGFVQITAFLTCAVMWIVDGRPQIMGLFNVSPKISLLGGVIGAFITYTVVKAMSDLGVAKAEITIVISQIAVAYIIELFGLFGSEKKDFKKTTEQIHSCMELCDGYFTSTDTLAGEIRRDIPGKPVVINRNCASMEMQILSHDAVEQVEKDPEHISIGYFSGSKTHDQDFEVAEEAILEVMKEHPEVRLKLVGVLSDRKMEKFGNKVEKLPLMDWKQLPSVMAGIDINLMPLENSLFHLCKSENKWTEAALVKVPSVMSRNCEMEYVVENGKDGWMCTTKEEWVNALEALVTDEKARKAMGEAAHQKVMKHYLTVNTGKDAMEELLCSESYTK